MDPPDPVDPVAPPAPLPDWLPPDERRTFASTNCSPAEPPDLPSEPAPVAGVDPRPWIRWLCCPRQTHCQPAPPLISVIVPCYITTAHQAALLFRRTVVETVGGFRDPWGADDLDFYLRAAYTFDAWCYQVPAVTRYRRYSTSSSRDGERMLHSTRAVYQCNWRLVEGDRMGEEAWHRGLQRLTNIFLDCVVENLTERGRTGDTARARRCARLLRDESPERWEALLASEHPAALTFGDQV